MLATPSRQTRGLIMSVWEDRKISQLRQCHPRADHHLHGQSRGRGGDLRRKRWGDGNDRLQVGLMLEELLGLGVDDETSERIEARLRRASAP
jgi:hypothetical protein